MQDKCHNISKLLASFVPYTYEKRKQREENKSKRRTSSLYARVNLLDISHGVEIVPVYTALRDAVGDLEGFDVVLSYHEVGEEARAVVPCEMAVEGPDTWIVGEELEHCVCWNDCAILFESPVEDVDIPTHWVRWIADLAVPCSVAFS
jgi:hypothetical protein